MNNNLLQLLGMAKYECKLHWRRRTMPVVFISLTIFQAFLALLSQGEFKNSIAALPEAQRANLPLIVTDAILSSTMIGVALVMLFLFPVLVSDSIPLDRQTGIWNILQSLPLPNVIYLLGKVMGMALAGLCGAVLSSALLAVFWWWLVGPYHLETFILAWLCVGGSLIAVNGGISVLLVAGLSSRVRAALALILIMVISLAVWGTPFAVSRQSSLWYLHPFRPAILLRYTADLNVGLFFTEDVLLTLAVGLLELVIVGCGAWLWLRWHYD